MSHQAVSLPGKVLFREHPALAVTMLYALVSAIGLLFNWSLFRQFGVNVFNFMEVGDFLLAALREPLTFVLSATALVVTYLIQRLGALELRWLTGRKDKGRFWAGYYWFSRTINNHAVTGLVGFLLYCYLFLALYADHKSDQIRAGVARQVSVELASESDHIEGRPIAFLGATNRFVFLFDVAADTTHIIPHENLSVMTPVYSSAD